MEQSLLIHHSTKVRDLTTPVQILYTAIQRRNHYPKPIEAFNGRLYPPLEQLGPERNNALQQQGAIFQTSSQRTHLLPLEQRN